MSSIINAVKKFVYAVYSAFGQKNSKVASIPNNTAYKKTHVKKKYPFSNERQHTRYSRQIANGQLVFK